MVLHYDLLKRMKHSKELWEVVSWLYPQNCQLLCFVLCNIYNLGREKLLYFTYGTFIPKA